MTTRLALGALLLTAATACTSRGPTVDEIAIVQDSYQVVELMGLTAVAVGDVIVAQGTGVPLLTSEAASERSRLDLARVPMTFKFAEKGEALVDLDAPDTFMRDFAPTVSGALKAEFAAVGADGYAVRVDAGNIVYDVTVTCTSDCVYTSPVDATTITLAKGTTYHFILHLDWEVFAPTHPFSTEPQVEAPRWNLGAQVELKGVQVAAAGARGGNGLDVERWTTTAHGERTSKTVLEVADGHLQASRSVVADWSLATTLNGVPHVMLVHRPAFDQVTLTIDGVAHGPYSLQKLSDYFGFSGGR